MNPCEICKKDHFKEYENRPGLCLKCGKDILNAIHRVETKR